jgi:polyisoprenoid-binding protein YceI
MTGIKTRLALTLIGLAGTAVLVAAAPVSPEFTQDVEEERMTFTLDPVHCMANFRVQHMGAGMFWGRFNDVAGSMTTSEDGTAAPTFDVAIAVDSVDTGTEKLDRTLMGPNFFDAKEFEVITFKSTSAEPLGDHKWNVSGDLAMLGTTKQIVAEVELTGVNGNPVMKKAGYEAIITIKRSDFGMDWGVKNGALADEVKLVVSVEGDWSA